MPTINQLRRNPRKVKKNRIYNLLGLEGNPQKKGSCLTIFTAKPKKPNSAIRKVARVRLSNGKVIIAYIPGQGHNLLKFSDVLVRGGRTKDVPGLRYKLIRGQLDFKIAENILRVNRRSKYGIPMSEVLRRKDLIKEGKK